MYLDEFLYRKCIGRSFANVVKSQMYWKGSKFFYHSQMYWKRSLANVLTEFANVWDEFFYRKCIGRSLAN